MIHIERARLPAGTRAFAFHEDGVIVVQVSAELSARERLGAIRQALRAAPATEWRSLSSPVLLPALAGSLGLRRAPDSPWPHRVLATAAIVVVVLIGVATITTVSLHGAGRPPAAQPDRPPLLTGPAPSGQPTSSHGSGASRQPGTGTGSSGGQRGPASGSGTKHGRKTSTTSAGGPAPQASGSPTPVPSGSSPQPSQTPWPSPSPSPSPTKHSGGSGGCVGLLVIKICL